MTNHGGVRPGAGRKKGEVSQAKRELAEMAKGHAEMALATLADIAQNSSSDAAKVSAVNALLDRGYGKPSQALEHETKDGELISFYDLSSLTDEQLDSLEEILTVLGQSAADGDVEIGEGNARAEIKAPVR